MTALAASYQAGLQTRQWGNFLPRDTAATSRPTNWQIVNDDSKAYGIAQRIGERPFAHRIHLVILRGFLYHLKSKASSKWVPAQRRRRRSRRIFKSVRLLHFGRSMQLTLCRNQSTKSEKPRPRPQTILTPASSPRVSSWQEMLVPAAELTTPSHCHGSPVAVDRGP